MVLEKGKVELDKGEGKELTLGHPWGAYHFE